MLARLVAQSLAICVVGALIGLALNASSAHGVSLATPVYPAAASATVCTDPAGAPPPREHPFIPLEEAMACQDCNAGFVDARGRVAFAYGHVPGAFHLPPEEVDRALEPLRAFDLLIVYDDDARCALAQGVADRLVAAGFKDVRLLEGSWTAWEAARGPAQTGACATCAAKGTP